MIKSSYETHVISNPLLPFRFHKPDTARECKHCTPNWHENIEILVCTRGTATVMLDGRQYAFSPGDICVANTYCVHTTVQEENLDYHCLIVDKKFCEENGIRTGDLLFQEWIRDPETCEVFRNVVDAFGNYSDEDPFCIPDIRYAVLGFLRTLCRKHLISKGEEVPHAASRERVKRAIEYINENFRRNISLQDVADYVEISKYYLSREFREFTGSTIFDTLNKTRCAEAKRMIEGGSTVSEAALSCGYENLSYFTRAFKKHLGECPSKYLLKERSGNYV